MSLEMAVALLAVAGFLTGSAGLLVALLSRRKTDKAVRATGSEVDKLLSRLAALEVDLRPPRETA